MEFEVGHGFGRLPRCVFDILVYLPRPRHAADLFHLAWNVLGILHLDVGIAVEKVIEDRGP